MLFVACTNTNMLHTYNETRRMNPESHFEVERLVMELDAHPEFWNLHPHRVFNNSPHREADDIWVRAIEHWGKEFTGPHESVWYPCCEQLPVIKKFIEEFASQKGSKTIGGVLITRIPPGKQVYWHKDGGWHAQAHRKWIVLLKADHNQVFEFEGEALQGESGECFEFENEYPHRVINNSDKERISLIICLRDFE